MRKLVAAAFVSLDGVMQAPGGPEEDRSGGFAFGGWTVPYWAKDDGVVGGALGAMFEKPFDLLLGRKTYEIFAAHWPHTDEPPAAIFNAARKYVATRSDAPLAWNNSVALHDAATDIARLKQESGPDLLTQGSSGLIQILLATDLIDEISLITFPVVLGKGKRFFSDGAKPTTLQLTDTKCSSSGVTVSRYARAGKVEIGTFELPEPSPDEKARRERVAREDS